MGTNPGRWSRPGMSGPPGRRELVRKRHMGTNLGPATEKAVSPRLSRGTSPLGWDYVVLRKETAFFHSLWFKNFREKVSGEAMLARLEILLPP
jgi:hypothetical protein